WDNSGNDSWDNSGNDSWDNSGDNTNSGDQSYNYDDASSGAGGFDSTGGADDGWGDWDAGGGDWGGGSDGFGLVDVPRNSRPEVVARPYERFTGMPYDSATELITYVEVVEVIIPDRFFDLGGIPYDTEDSLQARAERWMKKEFGEKEAKKMIEDAGMDKDGREGNTINALVVMPLIYEKNKYTKINEGVIEFDMELRFKEGRYRYKFENFVHRTPAISGKRGAREDRTYLEYYLTAKRDVRHNDEILMACNNQMNKLIDGLKTTCKAVPFLDDDESW
ncbi:MAG: DUF4468 domain-containing protein, partial [Flavobacteriales bacterium]|nr:DUF4468 domain-containing protein [Flavobacteriales bacterium]